MIDFEKIRQQPTAGRILVELLINALQLFLILYGLKCIITLHGKMPASVMGTVYNSIHWKSVAGITAAAIGLCYFGCGLFLYLSDGAPPDKNRKWFWRIGRAFLRWGSLVMALVAFEKSQELAGRSKLDITGLPPFLLAKIVAFIFGFITLQLFLFAMFSREQVKKGLSANGCKPLHVWWQPGAYWMCRYVFSYWGATGFRVIYSDSQHLIHKAYCFVYRSFRENPRWGSRSVFWLKDQIIGESPVSEVWASDEIMRSKLNNQSSQTDNLSGE